MSADIKEFTAYPIDLAKEKAMQQSIPKDAELDNYIQGLLEWAYNEEDVRLFYFAETTTEVRSALQKVITGEKLSSVAGMIANRLLKQEKAAQEEVAHLKGVHEGMLLQAAFHRAGTDGILLAKVDLSEFLGREDFRSQSGIDKKHRLLKFCVVEFSAKQDIQTVHVGDTNSTIAAYWWKSFLELTESRTNNSNTRTAFAVLDSFLGKAVRGAYPKDYPNLYNELLRRFKRSKQFRFTKFMDDMFDNYQPYHSELNVADLKTKAKALLIKGKFDANFTIIPSEVEKRFKRTYTLTPQIDLTVAGDLENFKDQISAMALNDGTKGVFIKSETGYDQFPPHESVKSASLKTTDNGLKKTAVATPQVDVQKH
jgi:hypothetical protein